MILDVDGLISFLSKVARILTAIAVVVSGILGLYQKVKSRLEGICNDEQSTDGRKVDQ